MTMSHKEWKENLLRKLAKNIGISYEDLLLLDDRGHNLYTILTLIDEAERKDVPLMAHVASLRLKGEEIDRRFK